MIDFHMEVLYAPRILQRVFRLACNTMILHGPLSIISLVIMLFSKALVVVATMSDGDYAVFNWSNNEELLRAHKVRHCPGTARQRGFMTYFPPDI